MASPPEIECLASELRFVEIRYSDADPRLFWVFQHYLADLGYASPRGLWLELVALPRRHLVLTLGYLAGDGHHLVLLCLREDELCWHYFGLLDSGCLLCTLLAFICFDRHLVLVDNLDVFLVLWRELVSFELLAASGVSVMCY